MQKLEYMAHCSEIGWMDPVSDGNIAGTVGQNRPMEAVRITGYNIPGLGIRGYAHVQDIGWSAGNIQGEDIGSTGLGKHIEAIKFELFGDVADQYTIWYRLHVSNIGFMPWVRGGEVSGTVGGNLAAEAIQIVLVSNQEFFWLGQDNNVPFYDLTPKPPSVNIADKIVSDAQSWVGYISEGGSDYSVFGEGDWCCKFVKGIFRNNGLDFPDTDWVPTVVDWAKSNGRWTSEPQKGYAIIFDFNENGTGDHIGIVKTPYSSQHAGTIEGNTGSPIGVYEKDRYGYILGYVNPF